MPTRSSKPKPRDLNALALNIVAQATGEAEPPKDERTDIQKAAAALGRLGGLKGGKARAKKLGPQQRSAIAKKAAAVRWSR